MEKIWLKNYPPGVPAEIYPDQHQSIVELFKKSCEKNGNLPSFYSLGVTITYKELDQLSRDFAAYLQQKLCLKKGERLAIMLPNILQYPIALFGALRAGLIVVNINPLYTAHELIFQLKDAEAETIIVLENFAHTVEAAYLQTSLKNVIVAHIEDFYSPVKALVVHFFLKYIQKKIPQWNISNAISFKKMLTKGKMLTLNPVSITNEDIAFLQYTGGTTGVSKGAMLTHRNIIANIEQAYAWLRSHLSVDNERMITALPLYHIFSLLVNCLLFATKVGGLNILIANPRDISGMITEMSKYKFTCITGVNTLFKSLLKNPRFASLDFTHLKMAAGGGMAIQRVVAEQWKEVTGTTLLEGYGLTETSPGVAITPVDSPAYTGDIGFPLPSTDVCIVDDSGHELPVGQRGELAVKGPQVMKGYWRQPEETKKVFNESGWFLTGDIAAMDEKGRLRILERKKDMILVSGFNVYPNEVEDVISSLAGVAEVAAVGVPDESSGEAIKVFVVKNKESLTKEDVIHYCRKELTAYKIPKWVVFCKELPKSNVGKILKRVLRDEKR